jgi:hypothetical protein
VVDIYKEVKAFKLQVAPNIKGLIIDLYHFENIAGGFHNEYNTLIQTELLKTCL